MVEIVLHTFWRSWDVVSYGIWCLFTGRNVQVQFCVYCKTL